MLPDPRPYFSDLGDPRRQTRNTLHKLQDIVMMVLCSVISGVEDWVGMETFAEEQEAWLRGLLDLPNGVLSHDTLSDVMGRIDKHAFALALYMYMALIGARSASSTCPQLPSSHCSGGVQGVALGS